MTANKKCDLSGLTDTVIDPYSKGGKTKLNKASCIVSSIFTEDGTVFFVGHNISKEVILAKGYFTLERDFNEAQSSWKSAFSPLKPFQNEKILITAGSGGPKQNGLIISPERGALISRALDKIKILNEGL